MKNTRSRKGFTLIELLIVIAIIAILSAIAIPAFSSQLEKARAAVDMSNARSASSLAYSEYMLCHTDDTAEAITYTFGTNRNGNLLIMSHSGEDGKEFKDNKEETDITEIKAKSAQLGNTALKVVICDGKITENSWLSILNE